MKSEVEKHDNVLKNIKTQIGLFTTCSCLANFSRVTDVSLVLGQNTD